MLIVNADDLGRNAEVTDRIFDCFRRGRITSASAMVFMSDSERAAALATDAGLETGLHLNLDLPFDGPTPPGRLREHHGRVIAYLQQDKWRQLIFNPALRGSFRYVFQAQWEEYGRLFGRAPVKVDGHDHMHLCMNMIVDGLIPRGQRVRRNLTFVRGQRHFVNRLYRRLVDAWLVRRYACTDAFFAIDPVSDLRRQERIVRQGRSLIVELMVHPGLREEYEHLLSPDFGTLIRDISLGTYSLIPSPFDGTPSGTPLG
jgi:predicted glycoside hydrolase/deacetylase ChbG (UPF0249 family)